MEISEGRGRERKGVKKRITAYNIMYINIFIVGARYEVIRNMFLIENLTDPNMYTDLPFLKKKNYHYLETLSFSASFNFSNALVFHHLIGM